MAAHAELPASLAGLLRLARRRALGATALVALVALVALPGPAGADRWSAPAEAGACAAAGAPSVLFPSDKPDEPTGPGALVWSAAGGCPGGRGARVDRLVPGAPPDPPAVPRSAGGTAIAPQGALAAAVAPHGQVAISGADATHGELLVQGKATGPFRTLLQNRSLLEPGTLASAYLGDLALLAPISGAGPGALGLSIERWFASVAGPVRSAFGRRSGSGRPDRARTSQPC
jgi:hypothetical protein